jgi:hypothetical protein
MFHTFLGLYPCIRIVCVDISKQFAYSIFLGRVSRKNTVDETVCVFPDLAERIFVSGSLIILSCLMLRSATAILSVCTSLICLLYK